MATIPFTKAKCVKTISGNSPQTLIFPEATSGTFKAGEFVLLTSGTVQEIGSNPAAILGLACDDSDGLSASTPKAVYIANDDNIFELVKVSDVGGAGAGGTRAVTAVTDVGATFSIYRDTTLNLACAGAPTGATERLLCIGLSEKDVVGDTGGRLLCMVLGKIRQLFTTSG